MSASRGLARQNQTVVAMLDAQTKNLMRNSRKIFGLICQECAAYLQLRRIGVSDDKLRTAVTI